jgi:D-3-phosphoglycerate dehydrogenase
LKILVCDPIADQGLKLLNDSEHDVDVKTGMSVDELEAVIAEYDAIIIRSATSIRAAQIDKAKNLKVIARGGVGVDNIDVKYAEGKGILIRNTPNASSISVAELTFAHMLSAARNVGRATVGIKNGKWEKKQLKGIELYGKTLGLIGAGRIAQEVAKRAIAFGMTVIAVDPYAKDIKDVDITLTTKEEVLKTSDFISLHVPLTDETRNIINEEAINSMKDGVIIVNCGRGGTIDETSLAKAINSGKVRATGLDVFSKEPITGEEVILKENNVSFTPHIGASTVEGQLRVGIDVAQVILDTLKGL